MTRSGTLRSRSREFETEQLERWKEEIKPGLLAERKVLEAEIANVTKSVGKATWFSRARGNPQGT